MGRWLVFLLAMTIGLVAWIAVARDGASAVVDRYAGLRLDHESYVHPTDEQVQIRRWYRKHVAELARPLPEPDRSGDSVQGVARPHRVAHVPGALPRSAMASGECLVRLRVLDFSTGEPLHVAARLWRLNVPGDERYGPGDEIRWRGSVQNGEVAISGLPAGQYRLECAAQRRRAEDPPRFWISASESEETVRLLMPREFTARARVFRLDGSEVEEMGLRRGPGGSSGRSGPAPEWARPRYALGATNWTRLISSRGCGPGDDEPFTARAGADGFLLERRTQADRNSTFSDAWVLSEDGFAEVRCGVHSDLLDGDVTFAAPLVPVALIASAIHLPDGAVLATSGRKFTAQCLAVASTADEVPEAWRRAEVEVRVERAGRGGHHVYRWKLGAPGADPIVERLEDSRW